MTLPKDWWTTDLEDEPCDGCGVKPSKHQGHGSFTCEKCYSAQWCPKCTYQVHGDKLCPAPPAPLTEVWVDVIGGQPISVAEESGLLESVLGEAVRFVRADAADEAARKLGELYVAAEAKIAKLEGVAKAARAARPSILGGGGRTALDAALAALDGEGGR